MQRGAGLIFAVVGKQLGLLESLFSIVAMQVSFEQ
jgi:hypothetical protein